MTKVKITIVIFRKPFFALVDDLPLDNFVFLLGTGQGYCYVVQENFVKALAISFMDQGHLPGVAKND